MYHLISIIQIRFLYGIYYNVTAIYDLKDVKHLQFLCQIFDKMSCLPTHHIISIRIEAVEQYPVDTCHGESNKEDYL